MNPSPVQLPSFLRQDYPFLLSYDSTTYFLQFLFTSETPTVVEIIEEDTQASGTSVQVFWHKPDRGASAITQYTVDCRNCKGEKSFETSNLFFEIKDLDSNTEYYILVVAKNSQGCGDKGDYVKVTTLAPSKSLLVNNIAFCLQILQGLSKNCHLGIPKKRQKNNVLLYALECVVISTLVLFKFLKGI